MRPYEAFWTVGRELWEAGLITTHGGNLSLREGDDIHITRRGSMLGRLTQDDVVVTSMQACDADEGCSRELVVHRAIYAATSALAIVHAHPVHTIHRSLIEDSIVPSDSEGKLVIGAAPVLTPAETIASAEAGDMLAEALRDHSVAVLRGHGPFAAAATLDEAFYAISVLEASAHVRDLLEGGGR